MRVWVVVSSEAREGGRWLTRQGPHHEGLSELLLHSGQPLTRFKQGKDTIRAMITGRSGPGRWLGGSTVLGTKKRLWVRSLVGGPPGGN